MLINTKEMPDGSYEATNGVYYGVGLGELGVWGAVIGAASNVVTGIVGAFTGPKIAKAQQKHERKLLEMQLAYESNIRKEQAAQQAYQMKLQQQQQKLQQQQQEASMRKMLQQVSQQNIQRPVTRNTQPITIPQPRGVGQIYRPKQKVVSSDNFTKYALIGGGGLLLVTLTILLTSKK